MPSNFLTADTSFPQLSGLDPEEQMGVISDYLFLLLEQLRYTLGNLGGDNFNDHELKIIGDTIVSPVYAAIEGNEGAILELAATAEELRAELSDSEGRITSLSATVDGIDTRVGTAEGNISTISQKVNSLTLSVTNGAESSTIQLKAGSTVLSSKSITMSGMVTFSDLSTAGATTINGGNITTGTINAIEINGCEINGSEITGSTFICELDNYGSMSGDIQFNYVYGSNSDMGARIYLTRSGAGTATKLIMETYDTIWSTFAMEFISAGNLALSADGAIYLAGTALYFNGSPIA